MILNIIVPCYLFTEIMNNIFIYSYIEILQCFLGCAVVVIIGLLINILASGCLVKDKRQFKFLSCVFSTSDSSVFLLVLAQICGPIIDSIKPPKTGELTADKRALKYIAIISIMNHIWKWAGCFYLIEGENSDEIPVKEIELKMLENKKHNNEESAKIEDYAHKEKAKNDTSTKSHYNFPLYSIIFSLLLCLIPPLQNNFVDKSSFLNATIISVNTVVGKSFNFCCIFLVGLFVCETMNWNSIKLRPYENQFLSIIDIIWISSLKLILMPLLCIPVILYLLNNIFNADICLLFVLFIFASSPFDMNLNIICGIKNAFIETCSILNCVMIICSIGTLILQVTLSVYVLGYYYEKQSIPVSQPIVA